jgi:6-pyruvoyltetrahydropterin/6-carboxytetrahydropterin synthase
MYSIQRSIEIDAGHRVPTHGSKCRSPHGHRYQIDARCVARDLPGHGEESGMVMDFGFLKEEMTSVIHDPCDHAFILDVSDELLYFYLSAFRPEHGIDHIVQEVRQLGPQEVRESFLKLWVIDRVPTAENLAELWYHRLAHRVKQRTGDRATLDRITVHETPNSTATYPAKEG